MKISEEMKEVIRVSTELAIIKVAGGFWVEVKNPLNKKRGLFSSSDDTWSFRTVLSDEDFAKGIVELTSLMSDYNTQKNRGFFDSLVDDMEALDDD